MHFVAEIETTIDGYNVLALSVHTSEAFHISSRLLTDTKSVWERLISGSSLSPRGPFVDVRYYEGTSNEYRIMTVLVSYLYELSLPLHVQTE